MNILKVGNLYHIGIAVRDAEKTAKLYIDTLGLKIEHDEVAHPLRFDLNAHVSVRAVGGMQAADRG